MIPIIPHRHKASATTPTPTTTNNKDPSSFFPISSVFSTSIIFTVITKVWWFISKLIIPSHLVSLTNTQNANTTTTTTELEPNTEKNSIINPADTEEDSDQPGLFPAITHESIDENVIPVDSTDGSAILCSTGLTTRLLPFKNANGEIEWAFTDDIIPGNELDSFKMTQPSQKSTEEVDLTPVTSSSSNNDSIMSHKKHSRSNLGDVHHSQLHNQTPMSSASSSSPFSPNTANAITAEDHAKATGRSASVLSNGSLNGTNDEDGKVHQCPHCDAVFKIRGYLTRHLKKHAVKKAYQCPFHKFSIFIDDNNITHKCHPSGGFSRRDTYKTHLKSRHFQYPEGTKTKERSHSSGNCSMCGEFFQNSEIWCEIHVEGAECKFLPAGFKGKSRIKNRLRKQLSKRFKEGKIDDATVSAAAKAAAAAQISKNKNVKSEEEDDEDVEIDGDDEEEEEEDMSTPSSFTRHHASNSTSSNGSSSDLVLDTPTSITTPLSHLTNKPELQQTNSPVVTLPPQPQQSSQLQSSQHKHQISGYEYRHHSNSPTLSISSSINGNAPHSGPSPPYHPIQQQSQSQNMQQIQQQQRIQPKHQPQQSTKLQQQAMQRLLEQQSQIPQFEQFQHHSTSVGKQDTAQDYDDEFCLDTEQLNVVDYSHDLLEYFNNGMTYGNPSNFNPQPDQSMSNMNNDINIDHHYNRYMNAQTQHHGY